MKRSNIILASVAIFGLILAIALLLFAIRFYSSAHEFIKNTPIATYNDSLTTGPVADSLNSVNANLSRQIAEILEKNPDQRKADRLLTLFRVTDEFIASIDSISKMNLSHDEVLSRIKVQVNRLNLGSRSGLFEVKDADKIPMLEKFMILDVKKLPGSYFDCLSAPAISSSCYSMLKEEALGIKAAILRLDLERLEKT
jgi:hypothetical protein